MLAACQIDFADAGREHYDDKDFPRRVRAIRAFCRQQRAAALATLNEKGAVLCAELTEMKRRLKWEGQNVS